NTGNISRTCAATGAYLHLVRPLGFSTDDAQLKRAGLDYWEHLHIEYHDSFQELQRKYTDARFFFSTTKGEHLYSDITFQDGDFFVFGKETKGLPEELLAENSERCIRIPMGKVIRSLNLSNSAAVVLYEGLRQIGYPDLV
ncbi:MAG: tRNA (cytidine(34)-2'-O)-methyltransferase, partial [Bacilli bacterium]